MMTKLAKTLLFLLGLVVLRQAIAFGTAHVDRLGQQSEVIRQHDIDPAAIFYTDSPLALASEKIVREKTGNGD